MNEDTRDPGKLSFLLVFILLAVGIVIAGWFYNRKIAQDYNADAARQLSAIANLKVDELVQWRKERLADSSVLFHNAPLSALVRRFLEKPEDADAQRQLQVWLGKFQGNDRYDEVRLLDAQGVWRLSLPAGLPPVSTSVIGGISNVLQSGQVAFQDFYRSERDQQVSLGILVPILDEQDTNRPLGVVYLRINPATYLYPFIQRWPTPSKTAETLLVRREGDEVLFLNELRFQTNTALNLRFSLDRVTLPAAQAVLGREGTMEGLDYRGVPALAALRSIPDSPWALVARMDNEEVYAPLRAQLWRLAAMLAALLIAAGAGVGLIWRQQSVRHYRKAEAEARASEQELRSLAESMPQIVWITRPDGWNIYFNRQWVDYTGLTLEESYGHGWNTPFHPDDRKRAWDAWQNATQDDTTYSVECRLRRADGAYRWWLIRGVPQRDVEGKILKWFGTCTDIDGIKQAEETLAASEVRYRRLFEAARDGFLILNAETGMVVDVNPYLIELLGVTREVFLGRKVWELGFFKDLVANEGNFAELKEKKYIRYEDMALEGHDGKRHEVEFVSNVYLVNHQEVIQCNIRDITERKQAEAALWESEQKFRLLFQHLDAGVVVHAPDTRIILANDKSCELLGLSVAQMTAKIAIDPAWRFVREDQTAVPLEEYPVQRVLATRRPIRDLVLGVDRPNTKDRVWALVNAYPELDAHERLLHAVVTFVDITARKRAEEELREHREHLEELVAERTRELSRLTREQQVILDTVPAMIWFKDTHNNMIRVNKAAAAAFGMTPEQLVGKSLAELTSDDADKYYQDDLEVFRTRKPKLGIVESLVFAGGENGWVRTDKVPCFDAHGDITGLIVLSIDITDRMCAEEEMKRYSTQLEASNKELDAFSYSVSHDLRAPLRHVQGYVDMLAQEAEGRLSDKGRHYMQTIADASREMGVLIDDLLAFSRMGRTEMMETSVDLNSLVQGTLRDLEETRRGRNIVWKIPPLPAVQADPAMLKLVLANLLGNAVKFTRPRDPAQIEIGSAGTEDGRVIVFVRDNGVGFDPQYAHKLFGIFQRLHRADEFEGTGIGLANVRRIIARHGGRTWAEGKLNEGATLYFTMKPSQQTQPTQGKNDHEHRAQTHPDGGR